MPFYTSNFKAKHKLLLFFLTLLALFFLSNFAIYHHFFGHTTKDYYINNMPSKEKHMALNLKNGPTKDAIFIGNSRTLFQMSTAIMHENGLNVYNLGISGHGISDFPSMVDHALLYKPKTIILSLGVPFFHSKLATPRDVDWSDIHAYIESHQSMKYISKALFKYFKTLFLINTYSTNINLRIRNAYKAFSSLSHFNLQHLKQGLRNPLFNPKKHFIFSRKYVKCKVFRMAYPKNLEGLGMCTNGDGILAGSKLKGDTDHDKLPNALNEPFSEKQLRLFNYLIHDIEAHGIKAIVVFTPIFNNPYPPSYRQRTEDKIKAPVIDLTDYKVPRFGWADHEHLNYKGRYIYSNMLAKRLKSMI